MEDYVAADALNALSAYLMKYYGKKVIILLDEYDTPMQEAYVNGYWKEIVAFLRNLFNSTFKTNPCLIRAVMTGRSCILFSILYASKLNRMALLSKSRFTTGCKI